MNENESNKNQVNEVDDSKLEDVAGGALFDGEILNPFIQEWAKTQPPYIINEFLDNLNNDKNFQKIYTVKT